jgi:hypothetical protein
MKRFRYALDPLCIACCVLYVVNRWLVKPVTTSVFLHGYFNDSLMIPCALPFLLWVQRKFGLRQNDAAPDAKEILFHLVIWSVLFEWIGPHIMNVTGDVWDVVAYTGGAVLAWAWWNRTQLRVTIA